jgi:hypothetical protein
MTLILSGSDGVTFPDSTEQETGYANGIGFRNRIINGDMRIDQRNAGASVTIADVANFTYTLDRWAAYGSVVSKFSVQQDAGAVTPPAGFTNYLGVTSLAATSLGASDQYSISQQIEGLNVADLAWGTANAKTVTLSFWVRSSLTGTFGGVFANSAFNRGYGYTYTINSADTWEQKSVTIPGDTSGTWLTTNGVGIRVYFAFGVGSSLSVSPGAWTAGGYRSATGATSVVGTDGATFYITGVQLEVGSVATPFERRPYGTELSLCQRYFQVVAVSTGSAEYLSSFVANSATDGLGVNFLPVPMRAAPSLSITLSGGTTKYRFNGGTTDQNSDTNPTIGNATTRSFRLNFTGFTGLTAGNTGWVSNRDSSAGYFGLTSEL